MSDMPVLLWLEFGGAISYQVSATKVGMSDVPVSLRLQRGNLPKKNNEYSVGYTKQPTAARRVGCAS